MGRAKVHRTSPAVAPASRSLLERPEIWSLFSGAMGLDLGLEGAGLAPTLAVEIDRWCCETIRLNRPDLVLLERDVRELKAKDLRESRGFDGDVFLIAGGPPCQSFSPGGNRAALSDPRGNLIYEFFRLVDEVRPLYFLFENVANLLTAALRHRPIAQRPGRHWNLNSYHANRRLNDDSAPPMEDEELSGSAVRALLDDLEPLGYQLNFGVLDAADHGAPQRRLRFVIVGARESAPPALPRPSHGDPRAGLKPRATVRDAIGDLRADPGPHYKYTERYEQIFGLVPPGGNWRDLPPEIQAAAMGGSFEAGGGKTGFFRRLDWDAPAPTITGKPNRKGAALCHPEFLRPLSVKECARIQGFPEGWRLTGPLQEQYRQIGNAVPVHLGEALGKEILVGPGRKEAQLPATWMLQTAVQRLRSAARNKGSNNHRQLLLSCDPRVSTG